jgi:hypothetical protein
MSYSQESRAKNWGEYERLRWSKSIGTRPAVGDCPERRMSDYKVSQHLTVKLSGGRLVDAEIKAIIETTEGKCLQVSFGNETVRIYYCKLLQVAEKLR